MGALKDVLQGGLNVAKDIKTVASNPAAPLSNIPAVKNAINKVDSSAVGRWANSKIKK